MANIDTVTDDSFGALVLQSDKPVLVDFSATWCGPCKAMAPAVEDVAREYAGEASVLLMDIDQCPQTKDLHGIMGVPTFMIFKGGKVVERLAGLQSRSKLAAALEAAIEGAA